MYIVSLYIEHTDSDPVLGAFLGVCVVTTLYLSKIEEN